MITANIVTPNGPYKTIETPSLLVGTIDGERGLLEHHMPVVLMLDISKLITVENNVKTVYAISGGMLYFENGVAKILVDSIERQDEIDVNRANEAKKRAEERIDKKDAQVDLKRAEVALKKAINRIEIASKKY